jgi:hypothetical protein
VVNLASAQHGRALVGTRGLIYPSRVTAGISAMWFAARAGLALCLLLAQPARATQYWLAGEDPVSQPVGRQGLPDYMGLFAPRAPWARGAARLSVLKVSAQSILRGTDDGLRAIFGDMRRRHVAMAVEMGAVLLTPECGGGEGYVPPDLVDRVAGKLRRLGLTLDYWAMDEPVWFGHERSWGPRDCTYPVAEVVRRVALNVAQMRRYFPDIQVGDIEVVTAQRIDPRQSVADYAAFAQGFARQTGRTLAFLHADATFQSEWRPALALFARQAHALGIRYGVIIGGMPTDPDDETWEADALRHLSALAANPALRPDDVVVQSWQKLPDHALPEDQPGSVTHELAQAEALLP